MNRTKTDPVTVPKRNQMANEINDVCDNIAEIQGMTRFLAAATTLFETHSADDLMNGAQYFFRLLDKRISEIYTHAEQVSEHVRGNHDPL